MAVAARHTRAPLAPPRAQKVCRFFASGHCPYGAACRYAHPGRVRVAPPHLPRGKPGKARVCKPIVPRRSTPHGKARGVGKPHDHPKPSTKAAPRKRRVAPRADRDTVVFMSDAVVEVPIAGTCRALIGAGGQTLALLTGTESARLLIRHVPVALTWDLPSGGLAAFMRRCGAPVPVRSSSCGFTSLPAPAVGDATGRWGTLTFGSAEDAAAALAALSSDHNPLRFVRGTPMPPATAMPDTAEAKTRPTRVVDAAGAAEVECPVCMDTITPGLAFVVQPCGHVFHRTCLQEMVTAAVDDAKNPSAAPFPIACPGESDEGAACERKLCLADLLGALLPADQHGELAQRSCAAYVQAHAAEWRYCPTADCKRVFRPARLEGAAGAADAHKWHCDACDSAYCLACDDAPYHEGKTCEERKRELEMAEERKFDTWVATEWAVPTNDTRQCPCCARLLERMSGCAHVQCVYCRRHFCWTCGFAPAGNTAGEVYTHKSQVGH